MKLTLELDDSPAGATLYISEHGLVPDARKILEGKTATYLFPKGKILGLDLIENEVRPDRVPIVVLTDAEYESRCSGPGGTDRNSLELRLTGDE